MFASDNPSVPCGVEREAWEEGRHAGWDAGGRVEAAAVQAACREAPTVEDERRAGAERTINIDPMSVTLDVSQLDMSALKLLMPEKSSFMLVIAETPQLEMGPYVAVAEAGSALYAATAVRREAVSAKA